jgi:hypothetical protein
LLERCADLTPTNKRFLRQFDDPRGRGVPELGDSEYLKISASAWRRRGPIKSGAHSGRAPGQSPASIRFYHQKPSESAAMTLPWQLPGNTPIPISAFQSLDRGHAAVASVYCELVKSGGYDPVGEWHKTPGI